MLGPRTINWSNSIVWFWISIIRGLLGHCTVLLDVLYEINISEYRRHHFTMQVPPVSPNNYSIPHQQQPPASTLPTTAEHTNNGTSTTVSSLTQTAPAPAPVPAPAPAPAPPKVKKKRANPVYITPVRRETKRACSDSSDEEGLKGDDSAWGPGGKRKKGGKKKGGGAKGKGKGRKSKNDDSDWTVLMRVMSCVALNIQPSLYFCKFKCGLYFCN